MPVAFAAECDILLRHKEDSRTSDERRYCMVKMAMLFSEEQMVENARHIIEEENLDVVACKSIRTADAINEARSAIINGAKLIVARGYQAKLIQQYTKVPVVEVRLTAQEVGLLLKKAIRLTGKEHPCIAMIVFRNMVPDLSHMEELFGVRLKVCYIEHVEETGDIFAQMSEDRPDCIIGGTVAMEAGQAQGYLTLFYSSTEESIREAVDKAVRVAEAMETQLREEAQFETVLGASFSGIIRVNQNGDIIVINRFIENLLGKHNEEVKGKPLKNVVPEISMEQVDAILRGERESITTSVNYRNDSFMILIAPIEVGEKITGAILSVTRSTEAAVYNRRAGQEMLMRGYVTQMTFDRIEAESPKARRILDQAREFALSYNPILLQLPIGIRGTALAKAIHNVSTYNAGPFISLDLGVIPESEQEVALFRPDGVDTDGYGVVDGVEKGAMLLANHGTIYLKEIDKLSLQNQKQIVRTMQPLTEVRTDAQRINSLDVRLIGSSQRDLRMMMEHGELIPEFFYLITPLTLKVPSLKECPEDLKRLFDQYTKEYSRQYHKNIHVTEGGYHELCSLPWEGNNLQLELFTERLVLSAKKRIVDELVLRKLYQELYPSVKVLGNAQRYVTYHSPEGDRIRELLQKYVGNRQAVAKELGISTTTLWRHMKKYGIEQNQ